MTAETGDNNDVLKIRHEFHLKEWESLRQEVLQQVDHTRKLEFGAVASIGAFYAWFVSANSPSRFILVIPTLLALLGGIRALGPLVRIQEIALYIRKIEEHFSLDEAEGLIGWERTRSRPPAQSPSESSAGYLDKSLAEFLKNSMNSPFKYSATMFWVATFAVSVLAWVFL